MRPVLRRVLGAGGVLALLLATGAGIAGAAAPEGPRLAFFKLSREPERLELLTVDSRGAMPLRLAGGGRGPSPFLFSPPAWSPDGSQIAFSSAVGALGFRLYAASADGAGVRAIPGAGGYGPVFSPDGRTIAFAKFRIRHRRVEGKRVRTYEAVSVWVADVDRGEPRRLTRWRNGLSQFPSSFSPDGATLAMTRVDEARTQEPEAVLLSLASGRIDLLAENSGQPVFSPDGTEVALVRQHLRRLPPRNRGRVEETTDLYALDFGDSRLHRLTNTPSVFELWPGWNPSGERLAYTQLRTTESLAGPLNGVAMQINPDGTCRAKVAGGKHSVIFGVAWQPGPGREAGRIDC
jgi:Tol biopolymer transport system component